MRVLIVDDNHDNLYMLQALLQGSGYEVIMAPDGVKALQLLRTDAVGLVISDILMPHMDGFQLCREIRADQRLRSIPFVFYTATYTSEEDEEFALGLGADRFILKPAEPETFMGVITEVIRQAKNGLIEATPSSLDDQSYFPEYSLRLKEKLEDKIVQARASELRYRNLYNSLRDVVVITDLKGTIIDVNQPAMRRTFGYEIGDLEGGEWCILITDKAEQVAILSEVQATVDGRIVEAVFIKKDGSKFDGELSALKLMDDNGRHVGNIAVIRDISVQKRLEAQLHQAQKMEAVGQLAGGVAHDYNNYLTVIMGTVEILRRRKPQWDEIEERLDQIMRAASHSRDLTRQLLAFSRKEVIAPVGLNLNELIEQECKGLARLIGEDIQLRFDLAPGLWKTKLDPTQFAQIVINLVVNARDAMPHGGTVTFVTSNVTFDNGAFEDEQEVPAGEYVQLEVRDSGCGMDQETQKHIFEPFYTTKPAGCGTGLGLATIYGIVKQNRGFIRVASKAGAGTIFTICFPRRTEVAADQTPAASSIPSKRSGAILLVEDDDAVRQVTSGLLHSLGYQVIAKSAPEEAISFCCTGGKTVDLILADVVLPGMSGIEMAKRIQLNQPGLPVLYMSGYASEMTGAQGVLEEGMQLLRKPFDTETLNNKIVSMLGAGAS